MLKQLDLLPFRSSHREEGTPSTNVEQGHRAAHDSCHVPADTCGTILLHLPSVRTPLERAPKEMSGVQDRGQGRRLDVSVVQEVLIVDVVELL